MIFIFNNINNNNNFDKFSDVINFRLDVVGFSNVKHVKIRKRKICAG